MNEYVDNSQRTFRINQSTNLVWVDIRVIDHESMIAKQFKLITLVLSFIHVHTCGNNLHFSHDIAIRAAEAIQLNCDHRLVTIH